MPAACATNSEPQNSKICTLAGNMSPTVAFK
jgi:hypothetical protein